MTAYQRVVILLSWLLLTFSGPADDFSDSVRHIFLEETHYRIAASNDISLFATVDETGVMSNGTPVQLKGGNGSDFQQWSLEMPDAESYRIKSLTSPWYLRADALGDGWQDGDPVGIHSWMGWNSQKWNIHRLGGGMVGIEMAGTGWYLDAPALSANTPLQVSQWNGNSSQQWVLELRDNVQSPAIVKGTDGSLLVFFKQLSWTNGVEGFLYASEDNGSSWTQRTVFDEQAVYGPTFFVNEGALYMIYMDSSDSKKLQLKKSTDHGFTWSNHVLATYPYAVSTSGGADVLVKDGILYYSFSESGGTADATGWSSNFRLRVASAPVSGDLTLPSSWTITDPLECPSEPAAPNTRKGWLEPNCVEGPDGRVWVIARVDQFDAGSIAAVLKVSTDRSALEFINQYPAAGDDAGFVDAPWAGASKFHFLYDDVSGKHLVLSSPFMGAPSENTRHLNARNVLALYETDDLKNYRLVKTLIEDDLLEDWSLSAWHTGFQYPAAVIEGDDLHVVSRTAYNGFWNQHDANLGTYHVLEDFRSILDPDGEVAHYAFNDSADAGLDTSKMRGSSADVYGAACSPSGQFGGGLLFDGADDWLGLMNRVSPKFHRADAVSLSVWIKNDAAAGTIYSSAIDGNNTGLALQLQPGMLRMSARSRTNDALQSVDFSFSSTGQWHHIASVWDFKNDSMRLWLDGSEQSGSGSVAFGNTEYTRAAPARQDAIGRFFTGGSYFSGALDEIRFFNKRLNLWEITDLYNGREIVPGKLIAYDGFDYPPGTLIASNGTLGVFGENGFSTPWKFDTHTGEVVSNLVFSGLASSGNALKITRNGAGWIFRGMEDSLTAGTYYLSLLFYRDDPDNGGSENWRLMLKHAKSTPVGASTKITAGSTSDELVSLQVAGDVAQTGPVACAIGSPVLMLLKFTIDDDGAETASMKWYNPGDPLPAADQGIAWDAAGSGEFTGGGGWQFLLPANIGSMIIDEFRLGTSLPAVLPGGYGAWASSFGVVQPAWGDDDADGMVNYVEYGLGGDPLDPADQGLPSIFQCSDGAFHYIHPALADPNSGLIYQLQTTTNLVSGLWTAGGYIVTGTNLTGTLMNQVSNRVPASAPQTFIRLTIGQ